MIGPTVLLDKSAFQRLAGDESFEFQSHFIQTFPAILAAEIVADLAKDGVRPEAMVAALARKFLGSGPPLVWDFRSLAVGNLQGRWVEMIGYTYPLSASAVPDPGGGGYGMFIDVSPVNEAVMRWARGQFNDTEREFAARWRRGLEAVGLDAFESVITENRVVYRRCRSMEEAGRLADDLLWTADLQQPWLEYLVSEFRASSSEAMVIRGRWEVARTRLPRFAPFATHCLRVTLLYSIAKRFELVPVESKDPIDLHYLNYLPFSMAFATCDTLQRRLAPVLARADQTILDGNELQADLRRRVDTWAGMPEGLRSQLSYAFGMYPFPLKGSIVTRLWGTYMGPWQPGRGNRVGAPALSERISATEEAKRLWQEATSGEPWASHA